MKRIYCLKGQKYGTINRDSFIGTYEEIQRGLIPPKKKMNLKDPGLYSTSCNIEYSEAEYALNMFMRHYPRPFIAKGETEATCGPCQLTAECYTSWKIVFRTYFL